MKMKGIRYIVLPLLLTFMLGGRAEAQEASGIA